MDGLEFAWMVCAGRSFDDNRRCLVVDNESSILATRAVGAGPSF